MRRSRKRGALILRNTHKDLSRGEELDLTRVRGLSPDLKVQQQIINMGVQAYAFGMNEETLMTLCKIHSTGRITTEDLNQMNRHFPFAGWYPSPTSR